jgi:uncharacterized membrane protein
LPSAAIGEASLVDTPEWARDVLERIEHATALDEPARRAQELGHRALGDGSLARVLRGEWLGHPLHPALTDLPIGFWTSAMVLDVFGGSRSAKAARRLVGWGVLTAVPTAAAGAADWHSMDGAPRRVGLVHGALNTGALLLYLWSWRARRHHRLRGVALGFLGATVATAAAYLGGELVFPSDRQPGDGQENGPANDGQANDGQGVTGPSELDDVYQA